MAEIKTILSAVELVYLMQECKGTILPGVTNPFQFLDEAEKSRLILDVEDSLEKRGIRKRAFGGKTTYSQELLELVKVLVGFRYYIGIDYRKTKGQAVTDRFYECDGRWMQISGNSTAFELSFITEDKIKKRLDLLPDDSDSRSNRISLLLPKQEFKIISRLMESGRSGEAKNRIVQYDDVDEYNKQFLIESLSFMTDYATITLVLRNDKGISVQSVSALINKNDMAEFYQTVAEDNRTMIGLRAAASGTWNELKGVANTWLTV